MAVSHQLRIGVLVDHTDSDYQFEMVRGVLRGARQSGAKTLIVPGGWLGSPGGTPILRNFIYDLLPAVRLDGLLVLAGSLSNLTVAHFSEWLGRFQAIPRVAIGLDLPGVPSVYVDNEHGMHAVVTHLIERHHHRRIAFIKGPSESAEAEARFRAYRRALQEHDIGADPRFVAPQGLGREDGALGVRRLLDEQRFTPATLDAIVAVNDDVALGAVEELKQRGIGVPDQVAVVGFDDAPSARSANPAMTTVDQCVELQGYTAARALLEALEKKTEPLAHELRSQAVIRCSCGCPATFVNASDSLRRPSGGMARKLRLALFERRTTITAELARAARGRIRGARAGKPDCSTPWAKNSKVLRAG